MNKIFKIVWNAARGKMMVVNEATSSVQTGKKAAVTVAVVGALASGMAIAGNVSYDQTWEISGDTSEAVAQNGTYFDGWKNKPTQITGVTDEASLTLTLGGGSAIGINGSQNVLVDNLTKLSLQGSNNWQNGVIAQNKAHVTIEDVGTFQVGTEEQAAEIGMPLHSMGAGAQLDVSVDNIYINNNGYALISQTGATANVHANENVEISTMYASVIAGVWGNTDKKANLSLSAGDSISITSTNASAFNIYDSYQGSVYTGEVSAELTAVNSINLKGNYNGVWVNCQAENAVADFNITSTEGSVNIDGRGEKNYGALDLRASDSASVTGAITAKQNVSLNSELGYGANLTNSSLDVAANNVVIEAATEGVRAVNGDVSIDAGTVSVSSNTYTAVSLENSNLEITADKAVITSESNWFGVRAKASTATIDAGIVEVASQYAGVYARDGSTVTLGNADSTSVKIDVTGNGEDTEVVGLWANGKDSNITVKGEKLEVNVSDAEGVYAYGVLAQGQAEGNSVVIDAGNTVINATTSGIFATGKGQVDVNGHLAVTGEDAITVRGESTVNVNQAGGNDVVLNGNISFDKGAKSGTDAWGNVNVTLDTANSAWNGSLVASWDVEEDYAATPEDFTGSKVNLTLANGAQWTPNAEDKATIEGTQGSTRLAVSSLAMNGGVINLKDGVEADVTSMSGSGTVNVGTTDGATTAGLNVEGAAADSALDVNIMNADLSAELTADQITEEQAKAVLAKVGGDAVSTTTQVAEGMYNDAMNIGADGTVTTVTNSVMSNVLDMASASTLSMNRILMNDVRKRMGDLRAAEGTHGVWARYDGGKLSGSNSLENDFTTIQVGIDTVPVADAPRFGVAFAYTTSDADMKRGGAEMDAFSLAFYGTKMYDNGMFVDVIGRMATADTDVNVEGKTGTMDNVALSLSGEFGWRFDVTNQFYVEPQAELTYTYVNADKLDLSGSVYEFDSVDSLIGRVGFAAGFKCPDNFGDVYVRASAVHEFLGDATVTGGNGKSLPVDGEDTWVEFGIGANFNINKNTYVYADIERTEGAKLEEDWRANVGVRYAF